MSPILCFSTAQQNTETN